jgi:hypothetical protein
MAVTATPTYGTATAVTITLASLASSTADPPVGRESATIDCTTIDSIDLWVGGKITVGTSPTASTLIRVYFAPSYDGTTFAGSATGSDAGLTPTAAELMRLAYTIPVKATTSNVTFAWGVSAAEVFGGSLPPKFNVFVTHSSVAALNATGGNHELKYRSLNYESA